MNTQADVALIAACQQGDSRAFRDIYDLYKDRIYALCRHMAGNFEDAEDLTQEVFISAFKNIQSFRAEAAFGTWLYRIATNLCLNRLRKRKPEIHSFEALEEFDAAPPALGPSPEDLLVRKELNRRLEAAVLALPENLRLVFVLGTLEGMRYKQIAEVCECSEEAVKMRVHRARKQVRDKLKNYLEVN
ncbi:MAG: sigma-70 family RNA polymerase sigma factor [bacterium]|nr:sigma-70 family RNA polymerase sigma factor [bacterium]